MEETSKLLKPRKVKIMVGAFVSIICILVIFFQIVSSKEKQALEEKIKEEYTNLLEDSLKDISQKYNLPNATVQVTNMEKDYRDNYIFYTTINFEGDDKAFDNKKDDSFFIYDFYYDLVFIGLHQDELPLSGAKADIFYSLGNLTIIELNGNVIFTRDDSPFHEKISSGKSSGSSSKDASKCKSCGREFTDDANKKSIRHTNMCTNCYSNYQFGTAAQSAADQYGR